MHILKNAGPTARIFSPNPLGIPKVRLPALRYSSVQDGIFSICAASALAATSPIIWLLVQMLFKIQ